MTLRPFFSYFGSKWRTAPRYGRPLHATIVEPFAGSAGYACRFPDRRVVLCDADPVISSLWRWLIGASSAEILALPVEVGGSVTDLDVRPEARALIGFWLNRGAEAPRLRPSQWMRSGIRPRSFWGDHARALIASQVDRIRHWTVLDDYRESSDLGAATWFIDPPYALAGRKYRVGSKTIDFASLGEWCRARSGQVIVCENEGADWLPFSSFGVTKATAGKGRAGVSREAVWFGGGLDTPSTPSRGYAWHPLPCGHAVAWDDRLGPVAPCRECDAAGFRAWAVGRWLVEMMAERSATR